MSTKVSLLAISAAIILLPWLLWRVGVVRRFAPLAVLQIMAGVALGPSLLGKAAPGFHAALFTRPVLDALDGVAAIGVLLYVFVTALHLDAAALRSEGRRLGALTLGSIGLPLALGAGAGWWMLGVPGALGPAGSGAGFVAAIAICTAVTALPVLAAILTEMRLVATPLGQTALALAALNDAALWLMLAVLLALVAGHGGASAALHLLAAFGWLALLLAVARPLLGRAPEGAVLVLGVSLATVSAAVSEALGTGYLIGAFAAGLVVPARSRAALLERLEEVTATVLLPFFFMATGLKALIEPGSASFGGLLAAAVAVTVVGKVFGTALPARAGGMAWPQAVSLGAMMQTKGLMEVVVLAVLHDSGLIGGQVFSAMVAMAVVCTVITAPLVRACQGWDGRRGARQTERTAWPPA